MKRRCKKALAGVALATAATVCRAAPIGAEIEAAMVAVQAAKPGSEEQKRAGQRFCALTGGPLAVATWTERGELKCKRVTDRTS